MNRMPLSLSTPEGLSALLDDELEGEEVAALLAACAHDEAALDCWSSYHLIGEVLRAPAQQACAALAPGAQQAFVERLNQRLAQEVVAAPVIPQARTLPALPPIRQVGRDAPAANDASVRWKLAAGFACLAAVCAMAWQAAARLEPDAAAASLVQGGAAQVLVASPQGTMVRDARLQELLAAHRQFGATSALREPSGLLHSAVFEMPQQAGNGR